MTFQRTPGVLEALQAALIEHHGDMRSACQSLSVSPRDVHRWASQDSEVAQALNEAQMLGHASLESVAYQRAVHGVPVPVYYKDTLVGYKQDYSDTLLSQMLKARVPAYATSDRAHPSNLAIQVNVMPRASSYDEWLEHRAKALSLPPHDSDIIDVVPEPVPVPAPVPVPVPVPLALPDCL